MNRRDLLAATAAAAISSTTGCLVRATYDTTATEKGTLTLVKEDGDWKVDSDESE